MGHNENMQFLYLIYLKMTKIDLLDLPSPLGMDSDFEILFVWQEKMRMALPEEARQLFCVQHISWDDQKVMIVFFVLVSCDKLAKLI